MRTQKESNAPCALSIIIPAYNEEDRIVPTLQQTLNYLAQKNYPSEIIVVSDGSKDRTAAVAERFRTNGIVSLKVLEYHPNRGKGFAVQYGMLRGLGRLVMFMDADYAVPIEYCEKGIALIEKGCDIAIASRSAGDARIVSQQNALRRLSAKFYTLIQNLYLGISYPDTQCGFKLFTRDAAQDLFSRQKLKSVIFDPEILWLAKKKGYRVEQFGVQWTHIEDSRIQYDSLNKFLFVFKELFSIKRLHSND